MLVHSRRCVTSATMYNYIVAYRAGQSEVFGIYAVTVHPFLKLMQITLEKLIPLCCLVKTVQVNVFLSHAHFRGVKVTPSKLYK